MNVGSRLRRIARSSPWVIEALAAFWVASALTAVAIAAAAGLIPPAVVLAGVGLFGAAAAVTVRARVNDARVNEVLRDIAVLRLAVSSIARETDSIARSMRRLDHSTSRAVASALGLRVADSDELTPDSAVIAAMVVLGASRELHFVGNLDSYEQHRATFETLGRDLSLDNVPLGGETAYLDRKAQRRRSKSPSLPTFVAGDRDAMARLITGDLAELSAAVLGAPEYLVVIPPNLRSTALRGGPGSTVESLGDAVVLVRRSGTPGNPEGAAP